MKKSLSRILSLTALATSTYAAPLTNGGFESGLSGWLESGGTGLSSAVSILDGEYADVIPTAGTRFAAISNNGVTKESLSQTFDITDNYLLLSYRFLTDEYNTGTSYNDNAQIILTVGAAAATLASISRNDLQAGGEGSVLVGATLVDNKQFGFDLGQSAWQNLTVNVSSYFGQSATLTFEVNNVGGNDFDIGVSQLAVDNVRTSAVPEPTAPALLISAIGWLNLSRSRRDIRIGISKS